MRDHLQPDSATPCRMVESSDGRLRGGVREGSGQVPSGPGEESRKGEAGSGGGGGGGRVAGVWALSGDGLQQLVYRRLARE